MTASTSYLRLECDLRSGRFEIVWKGRERHYPALQGAFSAVKLADGASLTSTDYSEHICLPSDVSPILDGFGPGIQLLVHHRASGRPELRQRFRIHANQPYLFLRLEVAGSRSIATNNISPLICDAVKTPMSGLRLDVGDRAQTLFVPYDNDKYIRYNSDSATTSYEVTAFYDNLSRHGFVLGSVSHDLWKTGITLAHPTGRVIDSLRLYGGVADEQTHDSQPHGLVSGRNIASPLVLIGFFPDWRGGLETYGRVCARLQPPLAWSGGTPIGWNSWAAYGDKVDATRCLAVSDFLKNSLRARGFENQGIAYVNLDSYWDNLTEAQIVDLVRHIHANGQKAGIYWTPFVCWGGDLRRAVEGSEGRYSYQDILLKDSSGKPVPPLDGGLPLDPTHPGTLQRGDWQLERFVRWGFDFVKLDFLSHGAQEGAHFDPQTTTGTQAYNLGMKRLVAQLTPERIGRPFFISLSIAPLFPAGYGHSRRVSCDTWGQIGNTEYMLNSVTYGWWQSGTLYRYNDPDHTVLFQNRSPATEQEARSRFNASVIAGTVLLDSDDLTLPQAQGRALDLLTNPAINALVRAGRPFRPVEGNTGSHAADIFVREDARAHTFYAAVFNYNPTTSVTRTLDLARLGLHPAAVYSMRDLWTKQVTVGKATFSLTLSPAASTILCFRKAP